MSFFQTNSNTIKNGRGASPLPHRTKRPLAIMLMMGSALFLLTSCRDELQVFQIERQSVFSFSYDNFNTQYAETVNFFEGKAVIHNYADGSTEFLKRYLLTASGTNNDGKDFIINIEIDLVNDGDYIGIYRPEYEKSLGGIFSFNYLEKVSGNTYLSYDLDPSSLDDSFLRVERQNMEEKLVIGSFTAQLQNDQDPDEKIVFYQGVFKDISYAIQ